MIKEFIFAIVIASVALFIIIKNLKNSAQGKCNCGSCSSHCPMYDKSKDKDNHKNSK